MKPLYIFTAGVSATVFMTLFMLIAPVLGLPVMNIGALLGSIIGAGVTIGWIQHFIIGTVLAFVYVIFFNDWIPVENNISRGVIYGIVVFIFSQINFTLINLSDSFNHNQPQNMAFMALGNCLSCLAYGAVLGMFFKNRNYI